MVWVERKHVIECEFTLKHELRCVLLITVIINNATITVYVFFPKNNAGKKALNLE